MKNSQHFQFGQFLMLTVVLLTVSCGSSHTVVNQSEGVITVSDQQFNSLEAAVIEKDHVKQAELLARHDERLSIDDPVVMNARAGAELKAGRHAFAVNLLHEALRVLDGDSRFVSPNRLPVVLARADQTRSPMAIDLTENAPVMDGLNSLLDNGDRNRLLRALRQRKGHIPYPPEYPESGLAGLAVESLNETSENSAFSFHLIQYVDPKSDGQFQYWRAFETVAANLIVAGVLAEDRDVIKNGIESLGQVPERYRSGRGMFIYGVGLYLTGQREWRTWVSLQHRPMFGGNSR